MAKKGAPARGGTAAVTALIRASVAHTLHTYDHDPAVASYGQEAADAFGMEPDRVFKTLIAQVDGELVVAVVPVSGWLDLKALAVAVGGKRAAMAEPEAAERSTGYVVGGISPFGQRQPRPTVVDTSARRHQTVFVSGGRRGLEIELAPADLVAATQAGVAPIGR